MGLQKHPHWRERAFHQFLLARARMPFEWGANDCALFAADGILACSGVDIAAEFRGKYSDEEGALAAIKEIAGGVTVADAAAYCAEKHGLVEHKFPLMAKRGDLVVIENGGNLIAALVSLNGADVVSVSHAGLVRQSIMTIKRSWSV